jgi:hypothetical protein
MSELVANEETPSKVKEDGDKEGKEEVTSLPFDDDPLPDIDSFAKRYPKYDHGIVTLYQIVRDLHIKQEVCQIEVIDGSSYDRNNYLLRCVTRINGMGRMMIPIYLDEEIDLPWIHRVTKRCDNEGIELYLCIHTPESIIYEMISTELP